MALYLSKALQNIVMARGIVSRLANPLILPNGTKLHYPNEERVHVYGYYSSVVLDKVYGDIPAGIILDIGASQGIYSLMASDKAEKIFAFEADSDTFSSLVKNVNLNYLSGKIVPSSLAIWDRRGYVEFYESRELFGINHSITPLRARESRTVYATTLDRIVDQHKLTDVDLVKVDVEGSEPQVLNGATASLDKALFKKLVLAVYHYGSEKQQVDDILHEYGYKTKTMFYSCGDIILEAVSRR